MLVTNIVVQISWIGSEIERIYVYLYIVYGFFSFVNFHVASPHILLQG